MYANAAPEGGAAPGAEGAQAGEQPQAEDDVVDAEIVDDEKPKKDGAA
jgi:molecular chaperone DnaK